MAAMWEHCWARDGWPSPPDSRNYRRKVQIRQRAWAPDKSRALVSGYAHEGSDAPAATATQEVVPHVAVRFRHPCPGPAGQQITQVRRCTGRAILPAIPFRSVSQKLRQKQCAVSAVVAGTVPSLGLSSAADHTIGSATAEKPSDAFVPGSFLWPQRSAGAPGSLAGGLSRPGRGECQNVGTTQRLARTLRTSRPTVKIRVLDSALPPKRGTTQTRKVTEMTFTTQCPDCGRKVRIDKERLGKTIECPRCKKRFEVAPGPAPRPVPGDPVSASPTDPIIPRSTKWAEPGKRQPKPDGR